MQKIDVAKTGLIVNAKIVNINIITRILKLESYTTQNLNYLQI